MNTISGGASLPNQEHHDDESPFADLQLIESQIGTVCTVWMDGNRNGILNPINDTCMIASDWFQLDPLYKGGGSGVLLNVSRRFSSDEAPRPRQVKVVSWYCWQFIMGLQ